MFVHISGVNIDRIRELRTVYRRSGMKNVRPADLVEVLDALIDLTPQNGTPAPMLGIRDELDVGGRSRFIVHDQTGRPYRAFPGREEAWAYIEGFNYAWQSVQSIPPLPSHGTP